MTYVHMEVRNDVNLSAPANPILHSTVNLLYMKKQKSKLNRNRNCR